MTDETNSAGTREVDGGRSAVVVTAAPLLQECWRDVVPGAAVFPPSVDGASLLGAALVVLDLPSVTELRRVLSGVGAGHRPPRMLWVHADIRPEDVVIGRRLGVTRTLHRSLGLAPVLAMLDEDSDVPRVSMIGRIRDGAASVGLTGDEHELLDRLGAGSTVTQLRESTGWSRHEVERLRVSALAKLGVHTTGEALALTALARRDAATAPVCAADDELGP